MPTRNSEYDLKESYWTPQWVFDALRRVEYFVCPYEAAPRDAHTTGYDFLSDDTPRIEIVTNPPYGRLAEPFVRHALEVTQERKGKVAMLLPHAFDTAKLRVDLWGKPFKRKWVLVDRILWDNLPHTATPSTNHAWYVWDWTYIGAPNMGWIRRENQELGTVSAL